ncbi:MAG: hypothetical protein ACOYM3_20470 [Terrimicrobiaceae bacterium]
MKTITLDTVAERASGWTHLFKIPFGDLSAAATTKTISLITLPVGSLVREAAFFLKAGFVGPSVTNLTLKLGWNGASVDDDDGLIEAVELATAGTEILAGDGTGAAFATKRTGFAPQESAAIEVLFTATGANTSVLTAGEVWVALNISDLSKLG